MSLRSGKYLFGFGLAGLVCALIWSPTIPAMVSDGKRGETSKPRSGIVLLKSGRVLHGTAVREGDVFVVRLLAGEMRVSGDDVRFVCDSLDDAYRIQSRRLTPNDADEHVELARWCLSYGMGDYAQTELRAALAIDPDHRDARLMLNRIGPRSSARATAALDAATTPNKSTQQPADSPTPHRSLRRPSPEPSGDDTSSRDALPLPSDLPRLARKAFIVSIEPVLFQSCARTGCHGLRATNPLQFELPRPSRREERAASEANFRTVLQYVDIGRPAESPILLVPMRKHGRSNRPIFSGPDDPGYRMLTAWVFAISNQDDSAAPVSAATNLPSKPKAPAGDAATPIENLPPEVRQQIQQYTIPPIGGDPDSSSEPRDPYNLKTEDQKFLKKLIDTLGLRKK